MAKPKRRKRVHPVTIPGEVVHSDGSRQLFPSMKKAKRALAYLVQRVFPPKQSEDEPKKAWVERQ